LDFWPLRRPVLRSLPEKLPFLVIMLPMCWVAWVSQATAAMLQRPAFTASGALIRWIGLLCYNIMLYAGNVVWPFSLSPYRAIPSDLSLTNPHIALAIVGAIVLLAVWVASARWSRPLFVGLTAFGIILLPALGPVRFMASCVADRFTYLPMVFLLLPLAALARRLEGVLRDQRWIVWAGLGLFAASLVTLTNAQQGVWRSSKTLWSHVAAAVPDLPKAQSNLALIHLEEENYDLALIAVQRALARDPESADDLHLLGRIYVRKGRAAEAISVIQKALDKGLGPVAGTGYLSLGEAYLVAGDPDAARTACEKALAAGRTPADTYFNMGDTAMRMARRFDLAAEYYRMAVEKEPDNALYRWSLGTALNAGGLQAQALEQYERALAILASQGSRMPKLEAATAELRRQIGGATTAPAGR
jgi:protein O-mannosyl-transferase